MRPRAPIAFAGLLIIALVAVIGFAAFSTSLSDEPETTTALVAPTMATTAPVSARVAAAVLAYAVSPQPQVETPQQEPTDTEGEPSTAATDTSQVPPPTTTTAAATTTTKPADTRPPALEVTSPDNGATVSSELVLFEGTTEPGAEVASGPYAADVDENGRWDLALVVKPGPNGALFTAGDAAGNETTVRVVVHYEPPTPTTAAPATTTSPPANSPTTTAPPPEEWSPLWPADAAGRRDVEAWRPLVAQYWAADRVECALGLIHLESRGNPAAHNQNTGAVGLLQHLLKYWKGRAAAAGFVDSNGLYAHPYNAEANIAAGAWLANSYSNLGRNWWSPWYSLPSWPGCAVSES